MHELIGMVEITLEGDVIKVKQLSKAKQKSGDFEKSDANEISELTKNILYIIQDVNSLKSKLQNSGNFIKIRIRNDKSHFEVAVGSSYIRVNKYKAE